MTSEYIEEIQTICNYFRLEQGNVDDTGNWKLAREAQLSWFTADINRGLPGNLLCHEGQLLQNMFA